MTLTLHTRRRDVVTKVTIKFLLKICKQNFNVIGYSHVYRVEDPGIKIDTYSRCYIEWGEVCRDLTLKEGYKLSLMFSFP